MQTTTNYGYNVPESGDAADITKVAQNFVDIDSDLKEVADTVNNTCSDLSGKIDGVGNKVDGVGTKVDSIQTSVESLPTSLETDFTEVKNAISDVKTDVSSVKTEVNSVKTSVDEVKTSNESSFTDVKNTISGVDTKVDNVDTSLANYNAFLDGGLPIVSNVTEQKMGIEYTTKTTFQTILSISGKGFLNAALLHTGGNSGSELDVVIDGKTLKFTSSDTKFDAGLLSKNHILSHTTRVIYLPTWVYCLASNVYSINGALGITFDGMLSKSHITGGKTFKEKTICISDGYIKFEKSLSLNFKSNSGDDTYVYYSYFLAD